MSKIEVINALATMVADGQAPVVVVAQDSVETITVGDQGPPGPPGPVSTVPGPPGPVGPQVRYGSTPPTGGVGNEGDFYINTTTNFIYGPKALGAWPAGTTLVGPQGIPGNTVLYGTSNPVAGTGVDGNFYINTTTNFVYGPKAAGAWPAGTSLVGPQGPQGLPGSGSPGTATPLMDGTAAVGTSVLFARQDHVHPKDLAKVSTVKVQKFTASGTYTPSPGLLYCIVECWGGGGAGGGSMASATQSIIGGGGGGGGYSRSYVSAATVGASKAVVIGAAGVQAALGAAGGAGGQTSFGATICVANGGNGGAASAYSQGATPGGAAGTGDVAAPGQNAIGAGGDTSAAQTITIGGTGASSSLGGGGSGGVTSGTGAHGVTATGFAAGGGGGSSNRTSTTTFGGAGTPGICVVTEYCAQ